MLGNAEVRATIAVKDIEKAKAFYGGTLGLKLTRENEGGVTYEAGGGTNVEVYPSQYAGTAKNTVVGFRVDDLEAAMEQMRGKGIRFEEYDFPGLKTENGVAKLGDDKGAWFADPDGNILALVQPTG